MKGNQVTGSLILNPQGENDALLEALSAHGVKRNHLKELARDPEKMWKVSRSIIETCALSTPVAVAQTLMKGSFFAPVDVMMKRDDIPFPRSVLERLRNTHVLFWGNGLTVSQMSLKQDSKKFFFDEEPDATVPSAALFEAPLEERWHLVSKVPLEGTAGKTHIEQVMLLPKGQSVASVRQVVWMSILLMSRDRDCAWRICDDGKYINCHEAYDDIEERISRISIQFIGDPPVIDFEVTLSETRAIDRSVSSHRSVLTSEHHPASRRGIFIFHETL